MSAALDFYVRLGWEIDRAGERHAVAHFANGLSVAFDQVDFVPVWDGSYRGDTGGSTVLGVSIPSRGQVDALYADLVSAGYVSRQPPYDAFRGSRYAIVEDPDGNPVGLMSPSYDEHLATDPSATDLTPDHSRLTPDDSSGRVPPTANHPRPDSGRVRSAAAGELSGRRMNPADPWPGCGRRSQTVSG